MSQGIWFDEGHIFYGECEYCGNECQGHEIENPEDMRMVPLEEIEGEQG